MGYEIISLQLHYTEITLNVISISASVGFKDKGNSTVTHVTFLRVFETLNCHIFNTKRFHTFFIFLIGTHDQCLLAA